MTDNFSKVAGRHLLKFGANVHFNQINIAPNATYNGTFMFQGTETGLDFADYLLGIASVYAQGDSKHFYLRNRYIGIYGQDRVSRRSGNPVDAGPNAVYQPGAARRTHLGPVADGRPSRQAFRCAAEDQSPRRVRNV